MAARKTNTKSSSLRYAPAQRLHQVKTILGASGASVYEIAERLEVSVRTAIRYLRALEAAGEPLTEETVGKRKVWRLHPAARRETIALSEQQMVTLFLSRRIFDFLAGTGFAESLDEIFAKLEATLRRRKFDTKNLERKLFDVNEAPYLFGERGEQLGDIVTALLREHRLRITREEAGSKPFLFEPYTLLVYKKGLYLVGFSHHHQSVRTFALDTIKDAEWVNGDAFVYPKEYSPASMVEGNFGLHGGTGTPTRVRLLFAPEVARYVRRRQWHPSQQIAKTARGVEMTMQVTGMTELPAWLLSWGDKVEVLEPESLREKIAGEHARAAARYGSGASEAPTTPR
jgi:proteasome accessory factor B